MSPLNLATFNKTHYIKQIDMSLFIISFIHHISKHSTPPPIKLLPITVLLITMLSNIAPHSTENVDTPPSFTPLPPPHPPPHHLLPFLFSISTLLSHDKYWFENDSSIFYDGGTTNLAPPNTSYFDT